MDSISSRDRERLRQRARLQREYAESPRNEAILAKWQAQAEGRRESPPVRLLFSNFVHEVITPRLQCEGKAARRAVGKFAEIQIFNNPLWRKGGGERLKVTFSPFTFYSAKQLLEFLNWSLSNGLMSPQTAREALCLDVEMESKRLIEAAAKPEGFRPVFEAKQGMMSGGDGRPPAEGSV